MKISENHTLNDDNHAHEDNNDDDDDDDDGDDDDNDVQTLTTRDCKGPQTNMPKNVGSVKT